MRVPKVTARLAAAAGLVLAKPHDLTLRRRRAGRGWSYLGPDGRVLRDPELRARLDALAVPPAYEEVRLSPDPAHHLQAVGRDAAGRVQYRYHPDWEGVREALKARRLEGFVEALPRLRRAVTSDLSADRPTRALALAAAVALVEASAIRAGNERYLKSSGSRGVATLHKSNLRLEGSSIGLRFKAKHGVKVDRTVEDPALARALGLLAALPGRRLFQFRDEGGGLHPVRTPDLNGYLRAGAECAISLKDFRTLVASAAAVETLADLEPAGTAAARRRQLNEAVKLVAEELANTPAVARRSYIHESVVEAFERGALPALKRRTAAKPFSPRRERLLLAVVRGAARRKAPEPAPA